jgi:hypothetical protein
MLLEHESPELRNDPEVVRTAVAQNGLALRYASLELRNDPGVVGVAVAQCSRALEHASPALQNDPGVVRIAVASEERAQHLMRIRKRFLRIRLKLRVRGHLIVWFRAVVERHYAPGGSFHSATAKRWSSRVEQFDALPTAGTKRE